MYVDILEILTIKTFYIHLFLYQHLNNKIIMQVKYKYGNFSFKFFLNRTSGVLGISLDTWMEE